MIKDNQGPYPPHLQLDCSWFLNKEMWYGFAGAWLNGKIWILDNTLLRGNIHIHLSLTIALFFFDIFKHME